MAAFPARVDDTQASFPARDSLLRDPYEAEAVARDTWHLTPEGRERVLKNWRGIPKYLERGHIAPITFDGEAYI